MTDLVKDAETVFNWLREPDLAKQFGMKELAKWADDRPVAEVLRIKSHLEKSDKWEPEK